MSAYPIEHIRAYHPERLATGELTLQVSLELHGAPAEQLLTRIESVRPARTAPSMPLRGWAILIQEAP